MHVCVSNLTRVDEVRSLSSDSENLNRVEICIIIVVKRRQLFTRAACKLNSLRNKAMKQKLFKKTN